MRRRFRNPRLFIEVPLLTEGGLRDLAERCGLHLPATLLRWYIVNGYVLPVRLDAGRPQFARWQLWTLYRLNEARHHAVYVSDHVPIDKQDRRSWQEQVRDEAPYTAGPTFQQWLELVILLQNEFAPDARGSRGTARGRFPEASTPEGRFLRRTYRRRISASRPLQEVGIARKRAMELRRNMGMLIDSLDPASEWYPIFRFSDFEKRESLKGLPRLAQELYVADRILELFLERLTGRTQPDPGYLHTNTRVDWVKKHYGRSKNYADPHFLEVVLAEYGLNTGARAVVFVEGHTEAALIPEIARRGFGYDLNRLGIEVRNLHGIGNAARAVDLIRYLAELPRSGRVRIGGKVYIQLRRPPTFVYLIADREGPFAGPLQGQQKSKLVSEFRQLMTRQFLMLFNPDFERANFSSQELAHALSRRLRRKVLVRDVAGWRNQRGPRKRELTAWLFDKYGRRIRKPDLVPFYLRLLSRDIRASDGVHFRRPVLEIVSRILRIRLRAEQVRDWRLRRYISNVP